MLYRESQKITISSPRLATPYSMLGLALLEPRASPVLAPAMQIDARRPSRGHQSHSDTTFTTLYTSFVILYRKYTGWCDNDFHFYTILCPPLNGIRVSATARVDAKMEASENLGVDVKVIITPPCILNYILYGEPL